MIGARFYGVRSLGLDEKQDRSPLSDLKGAVIAVPPGGDGPGDPALVQRPPFLVEEWDTVVAVAIAAWAARSSAPPPGAERS